MATCKTCGFPHLTEQPHRHPVVSTHWVGCWRVHLDCAVAIIERLIEGAIDEAAMRLIDGSQVSENLTNESRTDG